MKNVKILLICLCMLVVVEGTINICIPLTSDATAPNVDEVLQEITNGIIKKIVPDVTKPNLFLDHVDLNITHPAIDLYGSLDNVEFYNFHHFNICFLENIFLNDTYYMFDPFNLTFTHLRVEGQYNLTGDLGDIFDLYGDGSFWLELTNISLAMVNFHINATDEEICIPITLEIDLRKLDNHIDNLMYDEELEQVVNDVISAIIPDGLKILWEEWRSWFDPLFENEINDILHSGGGKSFVNIMKNIQEIHMGKAPYCYSTVD